MKIKTDTSQFVETHGSQPRGRGDWLLDLIVRVGDDNARLESFFHRGTVQEALRRAVRHVRLKHTGCQELEMSVQP